MVGKEQPAAINASGEVDAQPFGDLFDGGGGKLDGRRLPARNDLQWKVVSGGFSISVEGLLTGKLTTGDSAIAVIPDGGPVDSAAVTFNEIATGSGLLFRYKDTQNYWALVVSPTFGTWVLNRVVAGKTTRVTTTGFRGGKVVEVVMIGNTIQLWVGACSVPLCEMRPCPKPQ